eukprot:3730806-Karenia_brevis.AAC.1
MPAMARLDPCFFLVHVLVFQEVVVLFPLNVLHAQYSAAGAAYAVTLLLSKFLGWSLPASIHSVWCRELTAAAVFSAVLLNIGPTVAVDVVLLVYFGMSDHYMFWPLSEAGKRQRARAHPVSPSSEGAACVCGASSSTKGIDADRTATQTDGRSQSVEPIAPWLCEPCLSLIHI